MVLHQTGHKLLSEHILAWYTGAYMRQQLSLASSLSDIVGRLMHKLICIYILTLLIYKCYETITTATEKNITVYHAADKTKQNYAAM